MAKDSCGTSHGVLWWCNQDPCGVVCAGVTWGLIFYAQYVVNKLVIVDWMGLSFWGVLNFLGFNAVAGLATVAHVRAMMTDPGAVPREATPLPEDDEVLGGGGGGSGGLEEGKGGAEGQSGNGGGNGRRVRKYCRRCNAFKPPRAHHCSICRRCVVKMDHHCPWVNNCVGIGNHKLFLLFVFYIFLMCTYALLLVLTRYAGCIHSGGDDEISCGDAAGNLLTIFLVIEAVLFGLFTCCMMLDQYTVVTTNTTAIDRLKGEYHGLGTHNRAAHDVNEVFGGKDGRFRLDWFFPVPAAFPSSLASDILGYRVDDATGRALDEEEGILMVDRRRSLDRGGEGLPQGGAVAGAGVGVGGELPRERLVAASRHSPTRLAGGAAGAGIGGMEEEPVEIGGATLLRPGTT